MSLEPLIQFRGGLSYSSGQDYKSSNWLQKDSLEKHYPNEVFFCLHSQYHLSKTSMETLSIKMLMQLEPTINARCISSTLKIKQIACNEETWGLLTTRWARYVHCRCIFTLQSQQLCNSEDWIFEEVRVSVKKWMIPLLAKCSIYLSRHITLH